MRSTFHIRTFGCQMNVADSNRIRELMEMKGFTCAHDPERADVLFINTCTVRQHAEDRAVSHIGRCRQWKLKKPGRQLIIVGCVVERLGKKLTRQFPFIDLLISSKDIPELPEILNRFASIQHIPPVAQSPWVTIMRGCDNHCSYCIVPSVRGPETSYPAEEILSTVQLRVHQGQHHITLLGQNVNSYRNGIGFSELLSRIARIPQLEELSFMTSHPKDLNDDTITVIAEHANIKRTIHLPVQSGSSRILKKMNRRYTREDYLSLLKKIRIRIPDCRFTTDFIVGFPGETAEDFADTLSLIDKADFHSAYVFKYSSRTGTPADSYPDRVGQAIIDQRHTVILQTLKERAHARAA